MVTKKNDTERDTRIFGLFLAGATFHQIATAVECSIDTVDAVVVSYLSTDRRRDLLTNHGHAVNIERAEALLKAHWGQAMRGDHRSAEICRRILADKSKELSLAGHRLIVEGDAVDEIAARRTARRASTAKGAARAKRSV